MLTARKRLMDKLECEDDDLAIIKALDVRLVLLDSRLNSFIKRGNKIKVFRLKIERVALEALAKEVLC